jgi:cyclophilin family peptidyl-prolyl cis-trans isomerase
MISKRSAVKLILVVAIVAIGGLYWYYAEHKTSPIEEAEKAANINLNLNTGENANLNANAPESMAPEAGGTPKIMNKLNPPTVLPIAERTGKEAVIETNKGTIVFALLPDAPLAASNFIELAKAGFYDGLTFHRVVSDFVIQGGDPQGTGMGGPGYQFKDEPLKRSYAPGIVAMANSGPNTNGSQFFIVLPGGEDKLGPLYTIFGKVTMGMDAVEKIVVGDVMTKVTIQDVKK